MWNLVQIMQLNIIGPTSSRNTAWLPFKSPLLQSQCRRILTYVVTTLWSFADDFMNLNSVSDLLLYFY